MPKRLIDLDDDLLAAAQRELRTKGVSDTVRIALQQAAARSARARQIEWLEQGGLESMADLLTATLAAAHQLTVVHYDADFETAATVLTFQHRWVLPRGSV